MPEDHEFKGSYDESPLKYGRRERESRYERMMAKWNDTEGALSAKHVPDYSRSLPTHTHAATLTAPDLAYRH